jgi:hypothetical protein
MLDLQARWAKRCRLIQGPRKPVALDSSLFESRHVSRHFEKRCRETRRRGDKHSRRKRGRNDTKKQGDRRRSRTVKQLPKLSRWPSRRVAQPPDPRRPRHHRRRAGLRAFRAAGVRRLGVAAA